MYPFVGISSVATPTENSQLKQLQSPPPLDAKALPLDFLLGPKFAGLSERVLARLIQAEAHAETYDERLPYRLAWHIVSICEKGEAVLCSPVVLAYYRVVGCHQDKFYERRTLARQAMLGEPIKVSGRRGARAMGAENAGANVGAPCQGANVAASQPTDALLAPSLSNERPEVTSDDGFTYNRTAEANMRVRATADKSVEYSSDSTFAAKRRPQAGADDTPSHNSAPDKNKEIA